MAPHCLHRPEHHHIKDSDTMCKGMNTGSDTSLALAISLLPSLFLSVSPAHDLPMLALAALEFEKHASPQNLPAHALRLCADFNQSLSMNSPISMLPNYAILPSGDEHGDFLVIDLGGLTLRVAVITIGKRTTANSRAARQARISVVASRSWIVDNLRKIVNKAFFSWICKCIWETLASQKTVLPLALITTGITWSFPLESTSYNTANIFHMAKGFVVDAEIVGCDLKQLLELAMLDSYGVSLNVQSIINDLLAVFSAARFLDEHTLLAMVLGTGVNFCCQLAVLQQIAPDKRLREEHHVLFNTETSLFGRSLLPLFATKYDCAIDARFADFAHFHPHMEVDPFTNTIFQPLELLSSGRYLPELARLVVVDMVAQKEIFANQKNLSMLEHAYQGFTGELMCGISESDNDFSVAELVEKHFSWAPQLISLPDAANLRMLVDAILGRAAYVLAVAIVAYVKLLAQHNGEFKDSQISIGYVGSVMEYFESLRNAVTRLVNECADVADLGVFVSLESINESSLVGTAIAAASQCNRSK